MCGNKPRAELLVKRRCRTDAIEDERPPEVLVEVGPDRPSEEGAQCAPGRDGAEEEGAVAGVQVAAGDARHRREVDA